MSALLLYWKPLLLALFLAIVVGGAYRAGGNAVRVEWQAQKVADQSAFETALAKARAERDAEIQKHTDLQTTASAASTLRKKETQNATDNLAAAYRSGALGLRVRAVCPAPGDGALPNAAADPGGPAATTELRLDPNLAADLIAYAGRAQQLQLDYARCYQALVDDRK